MDLSGLRRRGRRVRDFTVKHPNHFILLWTSSVASYLALRLSARLAAHGYRLDAVQLQGVTESHSRAHLRKKAEGPTKKPEGRRSSERERSCARRVTAVWGPVPTRPQGTTEPQRKHVIVIVIPSEQRRHTRLHRERKCAKKVRCFCLRRLSTRRPSRHDSLSHPPATAGSPRAFDALHSESRIVHSQPP